MKILASLSAAILSAAISCQVCAARTVWLHELDLGKVDQSAGIARANMSMWRTPLAIAADTFQLGVGTHAAGTMRLKLDGRTRSFSALVGVDSSAPAHELRRASVEFSAWVDGKEVWRSGVMRADDKARPVTLDLSGARSLVLAVGHCDDGISGDRADWVNARFEVDGDSPEMVLRPREEEYRLTPAPSPAPRFNSPAVYGARPGRPFLFTLPVSGERPMKFSAEALPPTLSLDPESGVLSGTAPEAAGEYRITATASNAYGSDSAELLIKTGDRIALTPPMGWNSWNVYGAEISDSIVRRIADAMVALRLPDYGYSYINIDDGWQGSRGGRFGAVMPNEKFPDMKALADYVHSKGLKIGIYSSPWVETFAGYIGGSADTPDGRVIDSSRRKGEFSFAPNDVAQWADWGFDYLKYDWVTNDTVSTREMSELLKASGRDILFSISNAAPIELADHWAALTETWRTTGDIRDSWHSMTTIGFMEDPWRRFQGPGHWNDPDMLVLGRVGWGDGLRPTALSPDEQYTHMTLWSILAAPLLIGCDLTAVDDFTLGLLTNPEILAVNQDSLGIQGTRAVHDSGHEIWTKELSDGSTAVAIFNIGEQARSFRLSPETPGLEGISGSPRDLWRRQPLEAGSEIAIPPHGAAMIRFIP